MDGDFSSLSRADRLEVLRTQAIRAKRSGDDTAARALFGQCRALEAEMKAAGETAAPPHAATEKPENAVLGTPHAEGGFALLERTRISDGSYVLKFELPSDKYVLVAAGTFQLRR